MNRILVSPSILSADFSCLGMEVASLEQAGADWIHVDIMDGHFVPNISFGPDVVAAFRPHTDLPLDVHLMVEDPDRYVGEFADCGAISSPYTQRPVPIFTGPFSISVPLEKKQVWP